MRQIATWTAALALAAGLVVDPAGAQESTIIATVAPAVGLVFDIDGTVTSNASTVPATVTRERRGDRIVITIVPQ